MMPCMKSVDGCCLIAAEYDIYGSKGCHGHGAVFVWHSESHLEEFGDAHVNACCVRNEEYEGYD